MPSNRRKAGDTFTKNLQEHNIDKAVLEEQEKDVDRIHFRRLRPNAIPLAEREAKLLQIYLETKGEKDAEGILKKGGRDITLSELLGGSSLASLAVTNPVIPYMVSAPLFWIYAHRHAPHHVPERCYKYRCEQKGHVYSVYSPGFIKGFTSMI
jgi:hypothetical protein